MPTLPRPIRRRPADVPATPRRRRRAAVVAGIAASLCIAGVAAAGHTPWSDRSTDAAAGAARELRSTPPLPVGLNADPTTHERGEVPTTTALPSTVDAAAGAAAEQVASDETDTPTTDPAPSSDEAVPTTDEVASAAEGTPHEPTSAPATTAAPSPAATEPTPPPVAAPPTTPPAEHPAPQPTSDEPATGGTAGDQPAPTEAPTTLPAPTTTEHHVPQTMTMSCTLDGTTVTCSFTGTAGEGYARSLLLRGQQGAAVGNVLVSTTDTSATYVDAGLTPGTYMYTAIQLDTSGHNLGHSNPFTFTIAG